MISWESDGDLMEFNGIQPYIRVAPWCYRWNIAEIDGGFKGKSYARLCDFPAIHD
jgi:hypothetical protein